MLCVILTPRYRRARREWITVLVNRRRNEWCNIISSDESHFSVHPDNRRLFTSSERGTRNNTAFLHGSIRFGGGRMMVYAESPLMETPKSISFEMGLG
ncbi:transposable element Tcb2 transposase [Trichonephila clavata]|uniref:Transposable element Tcb2 transposase n=1 Tax=Trichonephila clavata TaxID=2740835 RepID=A0A8X6GQD7_TRICU|nr:transposable element Tcb2 transposase [Trichonephila clavata]